MNAKDLVSKSPIGALLILLLCVPTAHAQTTQNPKREVLFVLSANEQVFYNEYLAQMTFDGNKSAVVIEDRLNKEFRFEFNGRRIATSNCGAYIDPPFSFGYIDPTRKDGYAFSWRTVAGRDTTTRVNIKGKVYGPYEWAGVRSENEFWYSLAGQYYLKNESGVYGPFHQTYPDVRTFPNGRYIASDANSINRNGKESRYTRIRNMRINDNGTYTVVYRTQNGKSDYVDINGKVFGPYGIFLPDKRDDLRALSLRGKPTCIDRERPFCIFLS